MPVAAVDLSAYEWNGIYSEPRRRLYEAQNTPYVMTRAQGRPETQTVDDLIRAFLSILGDAEMPHGPSAYQNVELEAICTPASLSVLEEGTDRRVRPLRVLLDDRSRGSDQATEVTEAGLCRNNAGPLNATQLLRELRKPRYRCSTEPDAARRLLYVADPDCWVILALAYTAPLDQAQYLPDFFYKYLGLKTSLGIHQSSHGSLAFALEFHLQFYVWREGGPLLEDGRRKRNGKPLRRSHELRDLDFTEEGQASSLFRANIYEAQISCLISGLDHHSWVAYLFVDTYYQGQSSSESVEHYHSKQSGPFKPDPLLTGTVDANMPTWTPREYFLLVYECRLKQVKHALHTVVSRLLLKLEPYVDDSVNVVPRHGSETDPLDFGRKKKMQLMVNEANRILRQVIHSISRVIEVWDRFNSRDAAYLSDILKSNGTRGGQDPKPPFRVLALIGDHINDLRDLQRRAEEQQELCAGVARELEMQLVMEGSKTATEQQLTGELLKTLTIIGLLFVPFTATAALFSMQPGVIPSQLVSGGVFLASWLTLTFLVLASVMYRLGPVQFNKWRQTSMPSPSQMPGRWRQQHQSPAGRPSSSLLSDSVPQGHAQYVDNIDLDWGRRRANL